MARLWGSRGVLSATGLILSGLLVTTLLAQPASAAPADPPTTASTTAPTATSTAPTPPASAAAQAKPATATVLSPQAQQAATPPPPITPLPAFDPGPNGTVSVPTGPSKALTAIAPLAGVDPAAGNVAVPSAPFSAAPQVTPSPLVLPTHQGQELVDATTADATTTLTNAGRLNADGTPNLDANALQPQMPSAKFIDPTKRATLQDLINALASGNLPPPLPVDPLALLQALPDGIPRITYRVCSESASKAASCSITLPLAVPALVNVTGDNTPDVLFDLVPVAAPGDIINAATQLLDVQKQIDDAQNTLNGILEILKDPLQAILHPELLVEELQLEQTLSDLATTLQQKLTALLDLVDLGVAPLEIRLPTSETTGKALSAHIWGVYDLPTHKRLSVGFDGYRRGDTLPTAALGVFTFNVGQFLKGVYDINATLLTVGAGNAMAITAGLGTVSDDTNGDVVDPTVASSRFSPVPLLFSAHAVIDPGSATTPETASVDATSTSTTHLDAQVLSDGQSGDSFTQAKIDSLPTRVSVKVTRPQQGPDATVHYTASSTIDNVLFANFDYAGAQLNRATQATAASVPSAFDATLQAATTQAAASDNIAFHYSANSSLAALDADYYDRAAGLVGRGALTKLPTKADLVVDRPTSHLTFTTDQPLGSATLNVSRDLGAFAPIDGDHATLVTSGNGVGISAQVSGLQSVEAYYDSHPRLTAQFNPGGQAFEAAANLDGDQKAQATVSNLPPSLSVDADTATGKIAYRASAVVHRVQVDYTKLSSGPTLFAAVNELPQSVDVSYVLGDKPEVTYQASSSVPRVELFASNDHIESLRPDADHYVSALLTGLPTKVDYALDIPSHHLEGTSDQPFGGIDVVARLPIQGRDWTADGNLTGVPAHFTADFGGGSFSFKGVSGPLGSAAFTATNHAGTIEPTGLHLAAYYRESTGDLDGSVAVRNLTTVAYAHTPTDQNFTLQADTGADPVYVRANVLLGADDIQLAASGKITNLPTNLNVTFSGGKLTYSADKNIGIELEAHIGKVAAIGKTSAPLFANGVGAMAASCSGGAGCAADDSPFCTVFSGHCIGLTAILNLPGLPTSVTVDTKARTVAVTGYAPPTSSLQVYLRLAGLIDALPDIRALATLSGLPSPVDFTVGPMNFNGSTVDAQYTASAPLGSLELDGQATTTNAQFPELRAKVTAGKLPANFHVIGTFGQTTTVHVDDSAPVDAIGVTVTSPTVGYLDGAVTGVPATADVTADFAAQHIEANMSAPIAGVYLLAHVPYQGRTWSAYVNVQTIPGHFTVDYAGGSFSFKGLSGPLGEAAAAITNHDGATAPTGPHLAVHYRQSTGDIDASAQINDLSSVSYANANPGQTFTLNMGAAHLALDSDVLLAAGGKDDTRLAVTGFVDTPNTLTVGITDSKLTYHTDQPVGLQLEAHLGKIAALNKISGVPLYRQGVALHALGCSAGDGCAKDNSPFCTLFGSCFGAVASVNLPGVPTQVDVDLPTGVVTINGYRPGGLPLDAFVQLDGLLASVSHLAGYVSFTDLPSPLNLTAGPFSFDQAATDQLHLHYTASGPIGSLVVEAEANTNTKLGALRGELKAAGLPETFDVTGEFGTNTKLVVTNSAPITSLSAEVTGTYGGKPASALATLSNVPKSVTMTVAGTDANGNAIKVPLVNVDSATSGMNGTVQVDALLALQGDAAQIHQIFAGFTNLGAHVAEQVTLNSQFNTYDTTLTSSPRSGSLVLGGSISVKAPDHITIPDINQKLSCFGVPLLGFHTDGYVAVPNLDIEQVYVEADGFAQLQLVPGTSYLAIGVQGDYDSFNVVIPKMSATLDVHIHVEADKFNSGVLPPLYDHTINISPNNPATSIVSHVYDMTERDVGVFDIQVFGATVGTYHVTHNPGLVGDYIPPPGSGLAGEMVLPPSNDTGPRQFVFSLLDPNLSAEDAQLLDIAVSYGLTPFTGSGGGASGPCS